MLEQKNKIDLLIKIKSLHINHCQQKLFILKQQTKSLEKQRESSREAIQLLINNIHKKTSDNSFSLYNLESSLNLCIEKIKKIDISINKYKNAQQECFKMLISLNYAKKQIEKLQSKKKLSEEELTLNCYF